MKTTVAGTRVFLRNGYKMRWNNMTTGLCADENDKIARDNSYLGETNQTTQVIKKREHTQRCLSTTTRPRGSC